MAARKNCPPFAAEGTLGESMSKPNKLSATTDPPIPETEITASVIVITNP